MTRDQAKKCGFCEHCAAYFCGRQLCAVLATDNELCQLDIVTQQRWIREHRLKL